MTTAQVDTSLVTFKAISNFTTSLEEVFGKEERPLKLYVHLINKTTLSHEKAIHKHIEAFRLFCTANRDALESKDVSKLVESKISYSERVYIDITRIFNSADKDTRGIIWRHLLTLSALVDPTGKARQILKTTAKKGNSATEANFLNDIIGKVEEHVDPDANPMDAVASIMKSGVFADLVGGMGNGLQDGSLDLGKLIGTVQTMVTALTGEVGVVGNEGENPMELINTMMGGISTGRDERDDGTPVLPDLGGIMNMMGPMLGALSSTSGESTTGATGIEAKVEAQIAEARKNGVLPAISEERASKKDS